MSNSIERSYENVFNYFNSHFQDYSKYCEKFPIIPKNSEKTLYTKTNCCRLLQELSIAFAIWFDSDDGCSLLRNNKHLLNRRDIKYPKTKDSKKHSFADFQVGDEFIEFKNMYFATKSQVDDFRKASEDNYASTAKIHLVIIVLNYDWVERLCAVGPAGITNIKNDIICLLGFGTRTMRIGSRASYKFERQLKEEDITDDVILDILKTEYDFDYNKVIIEKVKKLEEMVNFSKLDFSNNKGDWEKFLDSMVKILPMGREFVKNNLLSTEDIINELKVNSKPNCNSFNRDDSNTKKRMKNVMCVFPDRKYLKIEEVYKGPFEDLVDLIDIDNNKEGRYFKGIKSSLIKILNNFDRYTEMNIRLKDYNEFKAQSKSIIQDTDNRELTIADMNARRKQMGLPVISTGPTGLKTELDAEKLFFGLGKGYYAKVDYCFNNTKSFEKTLDKDNKAQAEIKDYESYMYGMMQQHRESPFETSKHPLLNMRGDESIYGNENLNNIQLDLIKEAASGVKTTMNSNFYRVLEQQDIIFNDILAGMLKNTYEGNVNNYKVIEHKDYGYYSIVFKNREHISGPILFFGVFEGENNDFPLLYPECFYVKSRGLTYWISKPMTVPIDIMKERKSSKFDWLIKVREFADQGINMRDNFLFFSLFLSWNVNVQDSIMLFYQMYKNLNQHFNCGKFEASKKISPKNVSDARYATILFRLINNWKQTVEEIRLNEDSGIQSEMSPGGVLDPIFGFEHKSMQTVFLIQFFKAILPKEKGIDNLKYLSDKLKDELEHHSDYMSCSSKKTQDRKNLRSLKTFYKDILGDKTKWETISWHPQSIITTTHKFIDLSEQANSKDKIRQGINRCLDEELGREPKNTAINCINEYEMRDRIDLFFKNNPDASINDFKYKEQSRGQYFGIYSEKLTINQINCVLEMERDVSSWCFKKGMSFEGFTKMPKERVCALYKLKSSVRDLFNTIHKKGQGGPDRAFFMQTDNVKYLCSLLDKCFRVMLNSMEGDVIAKSGTAKVWWFEENFKRKGLPTGTFRSFLHMTCDETRYGDTYPVEVLIIKLRTLLERGIFTRYEYEIFMYTMYRIRSRKILIPPQTTLYCQRVDKLNEDEKRIYINNREVLQCILSVYLIKFPLENGEKIDHMISENSYIEKMVGWILGNCNFFSSTDTYMHSYVAGATLERYFNFNKYTHYSHSDDSGHGTGLTMPTINDFDQTGLIDLMVEASKSEKERTSLFIDKYKVYHREKGYTGFLDKLVAVVYFILATIAPRLVGQRPSLFKWSGGPQFEMLQVVMRDGKAYEPITKWAHSACRSPLNDSYGRDIIDSCSRVYPYWINQGTEVMSTFCLIVANLYTSERYGLTKSRNVNFLRFDRLPEFGGILMIIPSLYSSTGLATNTLRLLTLNEKSRKSVSLSSKYHSIWYNNEDTMDEVEDSVFYTVKNFPIRLSVKTKLMKSFSKVLNNAKKNNIIPKGINTRDVKEFKTDIKEYFLNDKLNLTIQKRSPKTLVLKQLYNMTLKSRQESVVDKRGMIAASCHGYYKRLFTNPFHDGRPMSYSEIIDLYNDLVEDESVMEENTLTVFEVINSSNIELLNRFNFDYKIIYEDNLDQFTKMVYKRVESGKTMIDRESAHIILCLFCETNKILDSSSVIRTKTYDYYYSKISTGLIDAYNQWYTFFTEVLSIDPIECLNKFNQILGYMSSVNSLFIMKMSENTTSDALNDRIENNFSTNIKLILTNKQYVASDTYTSTNVQIRNAFSSAAFDNSYILQTCLNLCEIKNYNLDDIMLELEGGGLREVSSIWKSTKVDYYNDTFTKRNLNNVIIDILINKMRNGGNCITGCRKIKRLGSDDDSVYRFYEKLLSNDIGDKLPLTIKESMLEDVQNRHNKNYKSFCEIRVTHIRMSSPDAIHAKFTTVNLNSTNPVLVIEVAKKSNFYLLELMISFFNYFMLNSEQRRNVVCVPVCSDYKIVKYKDKTKQLIPGNLQTDVKQMSVCVKENFKTDFHNDMVIRKNNILWKKVNNLPAYIISPWIAKSNNSSIRLVVDNEVVFSDLMTSNREFLNLREVISLLGYPIELVDMVEESVNDSHQCLVKAMEKWSLVNNFLCNINALKVIIEQNQLLFIEDTMRIVNYIKNMIKYVHKISLQDKFLLSREFWSYMMDINVSRKKTYKPTFNIASLKPVFWFFEDINKIQFTIKGWNRIKYHSINHKTLEMIDNLQLYRGNHDIGNLMKVYRSLVLSEDLQKIVNTVNILLSSSVLSTRYRIDTLVSKLIDILIEKENAHILDTFKDVTNIGMFDS